MMKLHENQKLFTDAIRFTAQQKGIKDIYIEKDYWICFVLGLLFIENDFNIGFKGGTALSKCYNYIERFSEDIDLALLKDGSASEHQLKKRLKSISTCVGIHLPEVALEDITIKLGTRRKTAHEYPKSFKGEFGQVREQLIVEISHLGTFEPYTNKKVQSYISEMMVQTKQEKLIDEYNLHPIELKVLMAEKTICEKIMSLVRFSYSDTPIIDLNKKIRHIYDIHQLLKEDSIQLYFMSPLFDKMLSQVIADDKISFKNNKEWLNYHPKEALIFKEIEATWKQLSNTYNTTFKALVYGELPKEVEIIKALEKIAARLDS